VRPLVTAVGARLCVEKRVVSTSTLRGIHSDYPKGECTAAVFTKTVVIGVKSGVYSTANGIDANALKPYTQSTVHHVRPAPGLFEDTLDYAVEIDFTTFRDDPSILYCQRQRR
jgi:hypothetical protein